MWRGDFTEIATTTTKSKTIDSNAIGMFELFEKVWLRQKRTTEVHAQGMHDYVER